MKAESGKPEAVTSDLHAVAVCKGIERYVWLFDGPHRAAALASVWRMAADPELSLTPLDAQNAATQMSRSTQDV
jgi:hypothetical protein